MTRSGERSSARRYTIPAVALAIASGALLAHDLASSEGVDGCETAVLYSDIDGSVPAQRFEVADVEYGATAPKQSLGKYSLLVARDPQLSRMIFPDLVSGSDFTARVELEPSATDSADEAVDYTGSLMTPEGVTVSFWLGPNDSGEVEFQTSCDSSSGSTGSKF